MLEKGTTEDKMVGLHHQLSGHEFEQTLGHGDGQGGLEFYSPWGRKESDTTELLKNNKVDMIRVFSRYSHGPRKDEDNKTEFPQC